MSKKRTVRNQHDSSSVDCHILAKAWAKGLKCFSCHHFLCALSKFARIVVVLLLVFYVKIRKYCTAHHWLRLHQWNSASRARLVQQFLKWIFKFSKQIPRQTDLLRVLCSSQRINRACTKAWAVSEWMSYCVIEYQYHIMITVNHRSLDWATMRISWQ